MKTITKIFDSIDLMYNGYGDPTDGLTRRGKIYINEDGEYAEFYGDVPRKRVKNKRIFRDERTLLMRTPDGHYKLYCTFCWQGGSTWMMLVNMIHQVYTELKKFFNYRSSSSLV